MSGHKNAESMKIFQNHRHRGLPKGAGLAHADSEGKR